MNPYHRLTERLARGGVVVLDGPMGSELVRSWRGTVGVYPHVGRFDPPEWLFTDEYPPARYADLAQQRVDMGARVVGGCCGTTPEHVAALARRLTSP